MFYAYNSILIVMNQQIPAIIIITILRIKFNKRKNNLNLRCLWANEKQSVNSSLVDRLLMNYKSFLWDAESIYLIPYTVKAYHPISLGSKENMPYKWNSREICRVLRDMQLSF